ncbi:RNA-binding protein isoform 2 [Schistosoma japonicum]|uniref:RNA-binding protein isoform 2 n=1 Tax=Schistosoma japonicum TaxID=6182 RepID=A0A4Z2DBK2_SCHJA|nr:RNA-binding protein isoform 2 [Schistosoma japonicum]
MTTPESKSCEIRSLIVPRNRRTPVRNSWASIVEVLTKQLKLMVCMKTDKKSWKIFIKPSLETRDAQHIQKGYDFVNAFLKGFKYEDALAVVRIDGIYVNSFHITDVKQTLKPLVKTQVMTMVSGEYNSLLSNILCIGFNKLSFTVRRK